MAANQRFRTGPEKARPVGRQVRGIAIAIAVLVIAGAFALAVQVQLASARMNEDGGAATSAPFATPPMPTRTWSSRISTRSRD